MSHYGSPALDGLLANLKRNSLMKVAALAVDAAEMMPPDAAQAPPPGMMPAGPMPGSSLAQELRAKADESPDVADKQMLNEAANRFEALEGINAPVPVAPPGPSGMEQAAPPMEAAPQQAAPPEAQEAAPPAKTASARKSILEDDGGLADLASPEISHKTAGEDETADDFENWITS